ncbi:hypothetical protein H4CHR_05576 [Variovorax sp. PBS-H4]|uniref:hypothetical protein n=1 Tax=Variovorax sp. PBS-H4 TaxID=434008 RepID=UPI0013168B2C|nr:hypothetical protein [Variovorax sp. PBS-H4]VTU40843.1 hypothetical protein H4CHR_05576 [Variovorax sp. PBS-H4]
MNPTTSVAIRTIKPLPGAGSMGANICRRTTVNLEDKPQGPWSLGKASHGEQVATEVARLKKVTQLASQTGQRSIPGKPLFYPLIVEKRGELAVAGHILVDPNAPGGYHWSEPSRAKIDFGLEQPIELRNRGILVGYAAPDVITEPLLQDGTALGTRIANLVAHPVLKLLPGGGATVVGYLPDGPEDQLIISHDWTFHGDVSSLVQRRDKVWVVRADAAELDSESLPELSKEDSTESDPDDGDLAIPMNPINRRQPPLGRETPEGYEAVLDAKGKILAYARVDEYGDFMTHDGTPLPGNLRVVRNDVGTLTTEKCSLLPDDSNDSNDDVSEVSLSESSTRSSSSVLDLSTIVHVDLQGEDNASPVSPNSSLIEEVKIEILRTVQLAITSHDEAETKQKCNLLKWTAVVCMIVCVAGGLTAATAVKMAADANLKEQEDDFISATINKIAECLVAQGIDPAAAAAHAKDYVVQIAADYIKEEGGKFELTDHGRRFNAGDVAGVTCGRCLASDIDFNYIEGSVMAKRFEMWVQNMQIKFINALDNGRRPAGVAALSVPHALIATMLLFALEMAGLLG